MSITVKYFAVLRERYGRASDTVAWEPGMTVSDAWKRALGTVAMPERRMIAVNMEYTRQDATLNDGDEVAFFHAVTGG